MLLRRLLLLCLPVTLLMAGPKLFAGEIIEAKVEHRDGRYIVDLEILINANSEVVFSLLTDYDNLTALSDSIEESKILYSLSRTAHRVQVRTEACITFFCKEINQVQDVDEIRGNVVITTIVAEKSDLDYGHARWEVSPAGDVTRVTFNADLKPSFWVPPLIGPPVIEKGIRNEALEIVEGLETKANTFRDYR